VEPALIQLFTWYSQLSDSPQLLPWLRLVRQRATCDVQAMSELMQNMQVVPCFASIRSVAAAYNTVPALAGRSGLFDGGLSFTRFLMCLAIIGKDVAEHLAPRIQVGAVWPDSIIIHHAGTSARRCMQPWRGVGCETSTQVNMALNEVHNVRRYIKGMELSGMQQKLSNRLAVRG
jgi:hypothetical protein